MSEPTPRKVEARADELDVDALAEALARCQVDVSGLGVVRARDAAIEVAEQYRAILAERQP